MINQMLFLLQWINSRRKFRGILSNPAFCRAIYLSFESQQRNLTAILSSGEQGNKGKTISWKDTRQSEHSNSRIVVTLQWKLHYMCPDL